jgi:hypothetical protein
MAAHRYWRVLNRHCGDASRILCAEMEMRESSGGADVTSSAFAIASAQGASEQASEAFDNNLSNYWQVSTGSAGQWLGQDFGAGNEKDIVEITMQALSGFASRMTRQFDVQWSDDSSAWTTAWSGTFTAWTNAQQTFTKPAQADSRYWRLRADALQGSSVLSCAEMEMRATVGGADQTGSGSGVGDNTTGLANAFDNNASTFWNGANWAGVPDCAWLGYDFGSGVTKDIREISWTSRNGTTADQNPTAGWVESSSNGIDWLARWTFSGLGTWTLGSTQVFSDPALASGSSRRRMVMSW